jgi:hypothetical protein
MGIEDDLRKIKEDLDTIKWQLHQLVEAKRPKDRQDKEKRIKDTMKVPFGQKSQEAFNIDKRS